MKNILRLSIVATLVIAMAIAMPTPAHASWLSNAKKKVSTILNPFSSPVDKTKAAIALQTERHKNGTKAIVETHKNGTKVLLKAGQKKFDDHKDRRDKMLKAYDNRQRSGLEAYDRRQRDGAQFARENQDEIVRRGIMSSPTNFAIASTVAGTAVGVRATRDTANAIERNEDHIRDAAGAGAVLGSPTLTSAVLTTATGARATRDTAEVIDQNQETIARFALVGSPTATSTLLATGAAYETMNTRLEMEERGLRPVAYSNDQPRAVQQARARRLQDDPEAYQAACQRALGTRHCWLPN